MKKLVLVLAGLAVVSQSFAALPSFDFFANATATGGTSYTIGANLVGQTNSIGDKWYAAGSGSTQPIITGTNLSYTGLPTSTGNAVSFAVGSGTCARVGFSTVNSGSVYFSFILQLTDVSALSANGVFFLGGNNTASDSTSIPTSVAPRVYAKKSGTGYYLGVAKNDSTLTNLVFDTTLHATSDVLFVVCAYDYTSPTNTVRMWINPSSATFGAATAPSALLTATNGTDLANIKTFVICCRSTSQPGGMIDELRVGKSWAFVTGGAEFSTSPATQNANAGTNLVLAAVARGTGPLTYQWQKGGVNLSNSGNTSGVTTTNLTVSGLLSPDSGSYTAVVTGPYGSTTSSTAVVTVIDPAVSTQPASQTLPPGANAIFTAVAAGTPTLSYQWSKDGSPLSDGGNISGSATASLTVSAISPSDAGSYSVVVSNSLSFTTSSNAVLSISDPAILTQPVGITTNYGTTVILSVNVSGTGPFTYQWQRSGNNLFDGGNVSGALSSALTLSPVSYLDTGSYSVSVTNSVGSSVISSNATVVVRDPYIVTQPAARTNLAGTTATFSVVAAGSTLVYQWKHTNSFLNDAGNITGSSTPSLTVANVSDSDAGNYTVVISGSGPSVTSSNTPLTVLDPPNITSQPVSRNVTAGNNIAFGVSATGTAVLTYQWRKNGSNIPSATAQIYPLANVQSADGGSYSVVVSNSVSTATSVTAVLNVTTTPTPLQPTNLVVMRIGDGSQTLANTGNTMSFDQFTPSGTYVSSITLPDSGTSAVILNGVSGTEGSLSLSMDKHLLAFGGYNIPRPYSANISSAAATAVPRALATLDAQGNCNLAVISTSLFSTDGCRSAVTDGTNSFWAAGSGSGTRYFGPGGTNIQIQSTTSNTRVVDIFNGDLYFGDASGVFGVHKFVGLPTAAATESVVVDTTTNSYPYAFALSPSGTNLYITDDGDSSRSIPMPGISKWTYDGSTWTSNYTIISGTGTRGLVVDFSVDPPVLYATTAETSGNRLIAVTDTGASATATTLATAGVNTVFRGVRFGPVAVAQPPALVATHDATSVTLSWSGSFFLQSASNAQGPYVDVVGASSPYTENLNAATRRFFRLRN